MKNKKGFTLVELMAVIVILAILVAIAIPIYINITKGIKEKNYESKKTSIELSAIKYATENDLTSHEITLSLLAVNNYYSFDKYIDDAPYVFISNPNDEKENLACRVIEISVKNNEYSAEFTNTENCELAQTEINNKKVEIDAYKIENDRVVGKINKNGNKLEWVNQDVLLVVNTNQYLMSQEERDNINNFDSIIFSVLGNETKKEKNNYELLTNVNNGMSINVDNYVNAFKVSASLILDQTITVTYKNPGIDINGNIEVLIDKEAPSLSEDKTDSWLNREKGTNIYGTDGAGSGVKDICYVKENEYIEGRYNDCFNSNGTGNYKYSTFNNGIAPLNNMDNGLYYVWVRDNVGNISKRFNINISNIDMEAPRVNVNYDYELDSDVDKVEGITYDRKRQVDIVARDDESGIYKIFYCLTVGENSTCTPDIELKQDSENHKYITEQFPDMKEWQRICYSVQDVAGNYGYDSKDTRYGNYACSKAFHVDGIEGYADTYAFDDTYEFKLTYKSYDDESGVFYTKCSAKSLTDGSIVEGEVKEENTCIFKETEMNFHDDYQAIISVIDYANNEHIDDSFNFRTNVTIGKIYSRCRPDSNGYCTEEKVIKYDYRFALIHERLDAVLALTIDNPYITSRIDDTCCDHEHCKLMYLGDHKRSGIYGNGKKLGYSVKDFFESLPNNRTQITKNNEFYIDYIQKTVFKQEITDDNDTNNQTYSSWSMAPLPSAIYQTYKYNLPGVSNSGVDCEASTGSLYRSIGPKKFNGDSLDVGNWTITCHKEFPKDIYVPKTCYGTTTCTSTYTTTCPGPCTSTTVNGQTTTTCTTVSCQKSYSYSCSYPYDCSYWKTIMEDVPISKSVTVYESSDEDNFVESGGVMSGRTSTYIDNMNLSSLLIGKDKVDPNPVMARFGLMTYDEYAYLWKNIDWFKKDNIESLIATVVNGAVFSKEDFGNAWRRSYGHDGLVAKISALYAADGRMYAMSPVQYGRATVNVMLSYKKETWVMHGEGTKENPYQVITE